MRLGPELITNSTFDSDVSGWNINGSGVLTWVSGGTATFERAVNASDRFGQLLSVVDGKSYLYKFDFVSGTATVNTRLGNVLHGSQFQSIDFTGSFLPLNIWSGIIFSPGYTGNFSISISMTSNSVVEFDNISFREILPTPLSISGGFIN